MTKSNLEKKGFLWVMAIEGESIMAEKEWPGMPVEAESSWSHFRPFPGRREREQDRTWARL